MAEFIKQTINSFFKITTGSLFAATIFISIFEPHALLDVRILWQIVIISLLTPPLNFIFYSSKELSKQQILLRKVCHYLLLNMLLISCAYCFNWFEVNEVVKLIVFIVLIFAVYLIVSLTSFASDTKEATKLNEKIRQYQNNKPPQ